MDGRSKGHANGDENGIIQDFLRVGKRIAGLARIMPSLDG